MRGFTFVSLVSFFSITFAKHDELIGWKSYYLRPATQKQLQDIGIISNKCDLDVLSHPILEREGLVLVKPEHHEGFMKALEESDIAYRLHRADVKAALDYDDAVIKSRTRERVSRKSREMPYDSYQRLEVIDAYIEEISSQHPDLVTTVSPGSSFEGRPIKYVKISTTNFEDESKPVIFIDGGIHAREWIAPAVVTYAIKKLVENVTEDDLLDRFDWILLPVVNPDGYEYTFTDYRFWRKTRSTDQHGLSPACPGVDGNRNYDFFWNTVGTSNNPCSDTYAGSQAFSESETRIVRDIIEENLDRIALYLTMHSYGSMILYSWGHDATLSNNSRNLQLVGAAMGDEIYKHQLPNFPSYAVGNSVQVIGYGAAGASDDWSHSRGVPLSYTCELPGLDGGLQGFHLDPIYIEQVASETWAGIVVGSRLAGDLFVNGTASN